MIDWFSFVLGAVAGAAAMLVLVTADLRRRGLSTRWTTSGPSDSTELVRENRGEPVPQDPAAMRRLFLGEWEDRE